jgi:alpha(1,3/1,4) fucosyltransferase
MKKRLICHYVWKEFEGDRLYDQEDETLNSDDLFSPICKLKEHLSALGASMHTQDVCPPELADLILFENCPPRNALGIVRELRSLGKPMILNASESIFILPENSEVKILDMFDRVFTYQDDLIDGKKFLKFNYTFHLPVTLPEGDFKKKGVACMIAANKRMNHKRELYSERVRLIRWFERNHPSDFALFGRGWNRPHKAAAPFLHRKVLYKWPLRFFFAKNFSSYRGEVVRKQDVLREFRFSFCLENAFGIPGYVTEKIFDSMVAGCVPIYKGADNVLDHIPEGCFVDLRKYDSYPELYRELKYMSEGDHANYLKAIEVFFGSPQADPFRYSFFINSVSRAVCNLLELPFHPVD